MKGSSTQEIHPFGKICYNISSIKVRSNSLDIMEAKMRKTTKFFLIMISVGVIFAMGVAKDQLINSTWCPSPLRIDGTSVDWQGVALTFEKKVQVDYAFMNDADYLYVYFIFKDPQYLSSINQTGMTVYFNVAGKKNKDYGINFIQKKISAQQYIAMLEKQKGPLPDADKSNILANPNYVIFDFDVINKKAKENAPEAPAHAKPAVYRIHQDQEKNVAFEFAVPLARVAELAPGLSTEAGKQIKVGFEWGGMTEAMKQARMNRLHGRTEGEMPDDAKSGGQTGDRSQSGSSRGRQSAKKYDFWVDVQLASNQ